MLAVAVVSSAPKFSPSTVKELLSVAAALGGPKPVTTAASKLMERIIVPTRADTVTTECLFVPYPSRPMQLKTVVLSHADVRHSGASITVRTVGV
jgi:hypothetical protein